MNKENYLRLVSKLEEKKVTLVAVSKSKSTRQIMELYELGHRDFGENYVQELREKYEALPKDIRWHFIGHLQTNKVKYIAPFIFMIQSVDSERLLAEINKQAIKYQRNICCLLQIHIAREKTKYGLDYDSAYRLLTISSQYTQVCLCGLMGMATHTDDMHLVREEFSFLKSRFDAMRPLFNTCCNPILSMGMSHDYEVALACGSNMVRIGSLLFGERD